MAYAVGTGENASQNALIMVNGTGAEKGYRGQSNNFSDLVKAFVKRSPGAVAFNLNYSLPGFDGVQNLVMYIPGFGFTLMGYDISAAYGAGLLTQMTGQIEATTPGANVFVAGHSKGATVVDRAMKGSGSERITAGAVLSMPWFESLGQTKPGNQLRVTPLFDAASGLGMLILSPQLSITGFVISGASWSVGHESPLYLSEDIADYFAGF